MDVYAYVLKLFHLHWNRQPVRALGVSLAGLLDWHEIQLSLVEPQEKKIALSKVMDSIRNRHGPLSLFRSSSLTAGGMLFNRATKIGGHEA